MEILELINSGSRRLINKKIYAAGLDVYNDEPNIYSGYLNQKNVLEKCYPCFGGCSTT